MRTSNPAFRDSTFSAVCSSDGQSNAMTMDGTVHRACVLLFLVVVGAGWAWARFSSVRHSREILAYLLVGFFAGFLVALATILRPKWSPITAPIFALLQGLCLGVLSAALELRHPGIAIEAVALTFGTCFCLLLAYRSGLVRATKGLRLGTVAATGGIAVAYLASMVMSLIGVPMPHVLAGGVPGVIVSIIVVTVAALNLVLDFDFVERGIQSGAPKYMEWYAAFGLMLTLIWLYLEMLRLLTKARSDGR